MAEGWGQNKRAKYITEYRQRRRKFLAACEAAHSKAPLSSALSETVSVAWEQTENDQISEGEASTTNPEMNSSRAAQIHNHSSIFDTNPDFDEGEPVIIDDQSCDIIEGTDEEDISQGTNDQVFQEDEIIDIHTLLENKELQNSIKEEVAQWSIKNNLRSRTLNEILIIFRKTLPFLPRDCRALRNTMRSVNVTQVAGGDYVYLTVSSGLRRYIDNFPHEVGNELLLNINVDGLPLFKSKGTQLWPILGTINGSAPFAIAVWCGGSKPNNVADFLQDFIREIRSLYEQNFFYKGARYNIKIKAFVCDTPARAFLKCITGHTGYDSCERCEEHGEFRGSVRLYGTNAALRTNDDFATMKYEEHQHGVSPLADQPLGIPLISAFVLDYMHLVCLGVVRRMLINWKKGNPEVKLGRASINAISANLVLMKPHVPSFFQRQPRSLEELERWKATEFRFFLLYGGPVALKGNIPEDQYHHFLALSIAMRILLSEDMIKDDSKVTYAKSLLKWFVDESLKIYGPYFMTYNVHNLIHLSDDVSFHKVPLDKISAFPFENHLGRLKALVHSGVSPIRQVVKRLDEQEKMDLISTRQPNNCSMLSTKTRDRVHMTREGGFALIQETFNDGTALCKLVRPERTENIFEVPAPSTRFGICHVSSLSHCHIRRLNPKRLIGKALMLPVNDDDGGYAFIPLVHKEV